jgi:hypothetical protein
MLSRFLTASFLAAPLIFPVLSSRFPVFPYTSFPDFDPDFFPS